MRVVVLPVCQLELNAHVLLKYDFKTNSLSTASSDTPKSTASIKSHTNEFYLTPYCSPMLSSGSIRTVCEIIKNSVVLRHLFNIQNDDEPNLEEKIDFKGHCRFIAFGPETDICICALFIPHVSSLELNFVNEADPPLSRQTSKINHSDALSNKEKSFIQRDAIHLWISLNDLCHKLIHIDHVLKQPGILSKLMQIESWAQSYHENTNPSITQLNIDITLQLTKARARTLVWDLMEMKNEILYPHPVHGRIPNFRNNPDCSRNLAQLEEFQRARVIEICPSLAQEHLRLFCLCEGKIILTPAPSIDNGVCYKLDPRFLCHNNLAQAATKSGAAALGTIVNLTSVGNLHIDIFVVASVTVNPINGARLGKGKGYGDMEFAMMYQLGACDDKTLVVTTVHESQLLNDLPASVMTEHDLPVNVIVTPQRVVYTQNKFPRPHAINWNKIDNEIMLNLPIMKEFKRIQQAI